MTAKQQFFLQKASYSLQAAWLFYDQAAYDFSVTRAYYAMFYLAQVFLSGIGIFGTSHATVVAAFGREFIRNQRLPKRLHRYLVDAEHLRATGDYGVEITITAEQAREQMARAEEFLAIAQQHLTQIPQTPEDVAEVTTEI